jgi:flagella basal body P-ring formation protein FlgA
MRLNVLLTICAFVNVAGAQQLGVATVVANTRRPEIAIMANPVHEVSAGLAVQLQDIGGADFIDHKAQALAARTVLLEAFFAGEERIYTNIDFVRLLKEKIATQPELANYKFTYFVPEKVKVRGVKNLISGRRVASEILTTLVQKCESCSFKIKDLKIPIIESRADMYAYEVDTSALKITGSFLLPIRAHFESQQKTLYVTGSLQTKSRAFVTTKNMQMGERLESTELRTEEIELGYASDAFASEQDFLGRVLNKGVSLGRPIYKSDLKKEMVVSRGQMIRVLSGNEMFEVSSQMQAEESGAVGDYVKLKNTETQKMLSGQVIERGLVRVQ